MNADRYTLLDLALRELGSPLRLEVLEAVSHGPTSPRGLSRTSEATVPALAYHFRRMHRDGLLVPNGERRVRGAVEHFYVLTDAGRALRERLGLTG